MKSHLITNLSWVIFVLVITLHFNHVSSNEESGGTNTLLSVLKEASGIFTDKKRQIGLERTVLVTGCNYGFLNHLNNFKCFADRIGLKFLVVALDAKVYQHLKKHTNMHTYYMASGSDNTTKVTGDSTTFRSKQFNLITARKKEAVHDILALGYDVLFSDTDVAILRDPMPYLLWKNVDYVHSLNAVCTKRETWDFRKSKEEGNTGLYFVRSNNRTIKMWADAFAAVPKFPGLDDQAVFWRVIRRSVNPPVYPLGKCRHMDSIPRIPTVLPGKKKSLASSEKGTESADALVTCVLDSCVFSSGMLSRLYVPEYTYEVLMENLSSRNETIVTLHANYLKGGNNNKMTRMGDHGFWLVKPIAEPKIRQQHAKECIPFIPSAGSFNKSKS